MNQKNYFSCLLIGPPGSGKTTAAMTAPGPVLFLDTDIKLHKMVLAQTKLSSGEVVQWAIDDPMTSLSLTALMKVDMKPGSKAVMPKPKGYEHLAEMIDKLVEGKCVVDGVKYETVVLDSFTSMSEHLVRYITAANSSPHMTLPLYGTLKTNFEILISTLMRLPANIIIICHESATKDELTGRISYKPLIEGGMKDKIGKDFEEIYYMEKTISGDKCKYEMLTVGNSMKDCRTSRALPSKVEPNFRKIYGYE